VRVPSINRWLFGMSTTQNHKKRFPSGGRKRATKKTAHAHDDESWGWVSRRSSPVVTTDHRQPVVRE